MKTNNTSGEETDTGSQDLEGSDTVGMDLGDKTSRCCMLDAKQETVREGGVGTTKTALTQLYGQLKRCRIAL